MRLTFRDMIFVFDDTHLSKVKGFSLQTGTDTEAPRVRYGGFKRPSSGCP
jgi:hypothetical protein